MNRSGTSRRWQISLQIILLTGLMLVWLSPVIEAQQSLHPVVRPFYIDSERSSGVGVGCGQNLVLGEAAGDNNKEIAFQFFIEYGGYTEAQSAGIVGNLMAESGIDIDPTIHQVGGGPGRGIAQWTENQRWQVLLEFAEVFGLNEWDLGTQLSFIVFELQGIPEPPAGETISGAAGMSASGNYTWGHDDLIATDTPEEAALVFLNEFERAGVRAETRRQGYARTVSDGFAGRGVTPRDLATDIRCLRHGLVSYDINGCPEDAVLEWGNEIVSVDNSVGGGLPVHTCVRDAVEQLFADINRDLPDIRVTGGGWVSNATQIQKRINNCGGDTHYNIYEKPVKDCHPDTAKPGKSRHQRGVAIDFYANGGNAICWLYPSCHHEDLDERIRVLFSQKKMLEFMSG